MLLCFGGHAGGRALLVPVQNLQLQPCDKLLAPHKQERTPAPRLGAAHKMCCAANFEALDGWGDATGSRFTEEGNLKTGAGGIGPLENSARDKQCFGCCYHGNEDPGRSHAACMPHPGT